MFQQPCPHVHALSIIQASRAAAPRCEAPDRLVLVYRIFILLIDHPTCRSHHSKSDAASFNRNVRLCFCFSLCTSPLFNAHCPTTRVRMLTLAAAAAGVGSRVVFGEGSHGPRRTGLPMSWRRLSVSCAVSPARVHRAVAHAPRCPWVVHTQPALREVGDFCVA